MLSKILFTLAVAVGVLALFRWRRHRQLALLPTASPTNSPTRVKAKPLLKWFSLVVIALMIAAAALWLLHAWREAGEVVTVRVFDAGSGAMTEYQAYRSDLESRSFRTVDGRRVTLAETERMETSGTD